jgi:hypothetical protein
MCVFNALLSASVKAGRRFLLVKLIVRFFTHQRLPYDPQESRREKTKTARPQPRTSD